MNEFERALRLRAGLAAAEILDKLELDSSGHLTRSLNHKKIITGIRRRLRRGFPRIHKNCNSRTKFLDECQKEAI